MKILVWFATIRALQIMVESVTKVSERTKLKTSVIDWQRIKSFRNILVHDYLGELDYKIVRAINRIAKIKTGIKKAAIGTVR